jgi:hypothetical protein
MRSTAAYTVSIALVSFGLACGHSTGVTVTDSSPGADAWQLSYRNSLEQPVSCTANLTFAAQDPSLQQQYGTLERSFTLDPGATMTIVFPEPTEGPLAAGDLGYVVLYRPGEGEADGLFLFCEAIE